MPGEKTYTLAIGRWRRSGIVTIRSVLDTKIARFPIGFLASCGDNTWDYISFVVGLLVEADPQHPASIIDQITGQSVRPDDAPVPGTYRLVEQGALIWSGLHSCPDLSQPGKNSEVRFTTGPSYFTRVRPASGVPLTATSSSSRDSTDQVYLSPNALSAANEL